MPVERPRRDQLTRCAEHYGFHMGEAGPASFAGLIGGTLESYDAVEELYASRAPVAPAERPHRRVPAGDNPLGAWYVQPGLRLGADGPLAGRRVVTKGNITVAGPGGYLRGDHRFSARGSPVHDAACGVFILSCRHLRRRSYGPAPWMPARAATLKR